MAHLIRFRKHVYLFAKSRQDSVLVTMLFLVFIQLDGFPDYLKHRKLNQIKFAADRLFI
jgi:hypothetical protein